MVSRDEVFQGDDFSRAFDAEAPQIDLFDEAGQGKLPRLLTVVGLSTELFGFRPSSLAI